MVKQIYFLFQFIYKTFLPLYSLKHLRHFLCMAYKQQYLTNPEPEKSIFTSCLVVYSLCVVESLKMVYWNLCCFFTLLHFFTFQTIKIFLNFSKTGDLHISFIMLDQIKRSKCNIYYLQCWYEEKYRYL